MSPSLFARKWMAQTAASCLSMWRVDATDVRWTAGMGAWTTAPLRNLIPAKCKGDARCGCKLPSRCTPAFSSSSLTFSCNISQDANLWRCAICLHHLFQLLSTLYASVMMHIHHVLTVALHSVFGLNKNEASFEVGKFSSVQLFKHWILEHRIPSVSMVTFAVAPLRCGPLLPKPETNRKTSVCWRTQSPEKHASFSIVHNFSWTCTS